MKALFSSLLVIFLLILPFHSANGQGGDVAILSPVDGEGVKGQVLVTGYIKATGYTRYDLEFAFTGKEDAVTGFVYDSLKVAPLGTETIASAVDIEQPLMVRGEPIGQLAVSGLSNVSQEARDITSAIAAQTSVHLEALRLTEELQKRAEELRELDRLKSAFLANMSHELRTPLNSILGFTDVMLEGLDGELTEYMDNDLRLIQKNGQHLLHLINDVLDMAKIESGRMNLHPERFRVQDIFDDVNSLTLSLANAKNNQLIVEEDSDREVEIFADNTRIKQVMINLVLNAVEATPAGGTITVETAYHPASESAEISVSDTGEGLPPENVETLFDPFFTTKETGTGLGLAITHGIIEQHGGKITVESVPGRGATFVILLPTHQGE